MSDFNRMMRQYDSQIKHAASQELASIRSWYYSLSTADRQELRQELSDLVEVSKRLDNHNLFVRVTCDWSKYDQDGKYADIGASQPPERFVEAINQWEESEAFTESE